MALILPLLAFAGKLAGAEGGESVVVIFNSAMPESKSVAEHYARMRKVPADQVIGFKLSTGETISRKEFRESLEQPLRREVEKRGLIKYAARELPAVTNRPAGTFRMASEAKVRYAVLCYGVPLKISADLSLGENIPTNMPPAFRRNEACVDAELALLPRDPRTYPLAGLLPSPYYRLTNAAQLFPTNGILMVTRLDGPTAEIAKGLVDKALQAERDGLWGRAYFDTRNITATNDSYKLGDDWIRMGYQVARQTGFECVLDEKPEVLGADFPLSHVAIYEGWYDGHVSGPFKKSKVEFMPGAFAYHLHSYSAATLRSSSQHWVGPMLARGVTVTMGCVDEPYLMGTPDVGTFLAHWILRAATFGEAAWTAQTALSWQTTVVGDPLYRPFGQPAQELHARFEKENNPLFEWSMLRAVNQNILYGEPAAKFTALLERYPAARRSAVLQEKLGDLYFAGGKLIDACDTWQTALQLATSQPQRNRLILNATRQLPIIGREGKAFELLERLLDENPDWEDQLGIYERLLVLAERLGKADSAARFRALIERLRPVPPPATNAPTAEPKK